MSEADGRSPRPRVVAFCSTAEDIGQTTTLLNTAVLLARSDRRVLVLDGRNANVRVRHYVRSVTPATALLPDEEGGPPLEEWRPAGVRRPIGLVTLKGPDPLAALAGPGPEHPAFRDYDDVLIDAPLPRTPAQSAQLARLPHLLVVCFTAGSSFIEEAAALAQDILRHAERPIDVLALALQTDPAHEDQLRIARDRVRQSFERLGRRPVRYLEIPYHAMSARSTRLGTETKDGNGFDERVRPALDRLVTALSRPHPEPPSRATLVHTARHAVWADWIEVRLRAAGLAVVRRTYGDWRPGRPDTDDALLLLQPTAVRPDDQSALRTLSDPGIRLVLVDDEVPPSGFAHHQQIDLRRHDEPDAARTLLRGLCLPVPRTPPYIGRRYPSVPNRTNVAVRNVSFVGREALLDVLREATGTLADGERACLVLGAPGVGKSETLLEYCHRFGGSYDVVWWLQGDSPDNVRAGLAALGDALGEPTVQDVGAHVRALRAKAEAAGERWLLVCDELDAPADVAALRPLLPAPSGTCHILIAARGRRDADAVDAVEVPPFSLDESEALLAAGLPGLRPAAARAVAQRVGPLPLALGLACAWIGAAATRAEEDNRTGPQGLRVAVDEFVEAYTADQQVHGPGPLPSVRILLGLLRASLRNSPAAEAWSREPTGATALDWLLNACALISGAGPDLSLLRSRPLRLELTRATPDGIPTEAPARPVDFLLVDAALWALAQHGLVEFDFARHGQPVRQHRVLRELIVAGLGEERPRMEEQLRAAVGAHLLAATGRQGARDHEDRSRRGRQIEALRLWEDQRPAVQESLLSHLADLIDSQEERALEDCLRLAHLARQCWLESEAPESLRLRDMMSQALRLQGKYTESGRLALSVLRDYRGSFGLTHPRSLLMADAYAANLGTAGHFGDALDEALHVARSMTRLLGPRHGGTEQVLRNLAWRHAAVGDYTEGMRLLRQVYEQRRAISGGDDPEVWNMVPWLAEMHRLLGQDVESHHLLKNVWTRRTGQQEAGAVPITVVAENGLAVSERRMGDPDRAWERDARALEMAVSLLGEQHMITQRCRFSLAIDHHLLGEHDPAVEYAEGCLRALESRYGPAHPSTHLCRMRVGVHLRGSGRLERAREAGRAARDGMERVLGSRHPWTLAASVALAGTLVELGAHDEAVVLESAAQLGYDRLGFARHPARAVAADNLAMTRAEQRGALGSGEVPRRRRDIDVELFV